jgi:hypothetical protein
MRPLPLVARLGWASVGCHFSRGEIVPAFHKWFVWFPPPLSHLEIGFVHRAPRPWVVASIGAPRWV